MKTCFQIYPFLHSSPILLASAAITATLLNTHFNLKLSGFFSEEADHFLFSPFTLTALFSSSESNYLLFLLYVFDHTNFPITISISSNTHLKRRRQMSLLSYLQVMLCGSEAANAIPLPTFSYPRMMRCGSEAAIGRLGLSPNLVVSESNR